MPISRDEAAVALSEIERAAARHHTHRGYRIAGPILILWGIIWLAGYCAMGVLPGAQWGWLWLALDAIGVAGSVMLGLRGRAQASLRTGGALDAWRPFLWGLAIVALVGATFTLMRPADINAFIAYPGIVTGFAYVVFGLMRMPRLALIGAAMFAATLAGFFLFPAILTWWMAAVGGIGLILGGVWLRTV